MTRTGRYDAGDLLTHRSAKLERYALALGRLLPRLLQDQEARIGPLACNIAGALGFPAAKVVEQVNRQGRSDLHVIGGQLSPACYIEHSLPAVLYLAARYPDNFEAALVANTNVGGDFGQVPTLIAVLVVAHAAATLVMAGAI